MWKWALPDVRVFAGGAGTAPSGLGSALSLRFWTSLFSETANCIHPPVCVFFHLGGRQAARQISTLLGRGARRQQAQSAVFPLAPG